MRLLSPRPVLLALTLVAVVGAIAFIELRLDARGMAAADGTGENEARQTGTQSNAAREDGAQAQPQSQPQARAPEERAEGSDAEAGETEGAGSSEKVRVPEEAEAPEKADAGTRGGEPTKEPREVAVGGQEPNDRARKTPADEPSPREAAAERVAAKEAEYERAAEIVDPSGFVNADGFSVREAAGEGVVLLEFWTYTCFNCQNVQPRMNDWHERFADDGLRVVGVHTPEFGFERDYANVEAAVAEAGIRYPIVLDNSYATWNAYDNRYWPAVYLIDADGFVRYKHFGEGAYGATEEKIQELLAEKDRIAG